MALYSQRDVRWSDERLGTQDGATIGQYGCYTTAQAMSATNYGIDVNPLQLDQIFTDNEDSPYTKGGYVDSDLGWDGMLAKVYPNNFSYRGSDNPGTENPFSVTDLAPYDAYGKEAILEIDFDHNPNDGIQTHFVRLYAYNGGNLIIDDPWYGTRDLFSKHYGNNPAQTILKAVYYDAHAISAPVVTSLPPVVSENVLQDATPVQTELSATPLQAAEAETAIQAAPDPVVAPVDTPLPNGVEVEPDYQMSYVPFPGGPEDKRVTYSAEAVDMEGTGPNKSLIVGQLVKLSGTFNHAGNHYYRGTTGSWYGAPVEAFAPSGQPSSTKVRMSIVHATEVLAAEAIAGIEDKAGGLKRVATFLENHIHPGRHN